MVEARFVAALLASGGDGRIELRSGANTNQYGASPFPRSVRAYASSTANDVSLAAFEHLHDVLSGWPQDFAHSPDFYRASLEQLRTRIRQSWMLADEVEIAFAASGTDLEYLPLAAAAANSALPVTNILVGQDEVGSGCLLAASGRHFADKTPLGIAVAKGEALAQLAATTVVAVPIRDDAGTALTSAELTALIEHAARQAIADGRQVLIHVVHGSKTGLVLPDLAAIDGLRQRLGERARFVVDACQARSSPEMLAHYLERDCAVMVTGSKFIGGPPFSGFAFFPAAWAPAAPLATGLSRVFARSELPASWTAAAFLDERTNPGLLLRLLAAQFEVERFAAVAPDLRHQVISAFGSAVRGLAESLGASLVSPSLATAELHHATLATLDLSSLRSAPDFAMAQRWHRVLAARGLRLGQPVKCVRQSDGNWGGTLRLSLSMPLIVEFAKLSAADLRHRLTTDMSQIADVIRAAEKPVVA